ncbi:hypothetical protein Unana1_02482 [Umbelopsis nana]
MKFVSAAILAFAASIVSAQSDAGVLFNSPLTGTVWTAGSTGLITWTVENTALTTISTLDLRKGPSTALQLVQNVAVNLPVTPGQYTWNIPATLAAGTDYALTFGSSPNISYSGAFTIQAGSGSVSGSSSANGTVASSTPVSSAPATTSAPSMTTSAAPTTSAASSMAPASSSAAPSATPKSAAASIKAGVAGAGLVAGAVALFL